VPAAQSATLVTHGSQIQIGTAAKRAITGTSPPTRNGQALRRVDDRTACLLILNRCRKKAPKLCALDRILLGLGAMLVSPQRMPKVAVTVRPSTLLRFHRALVQRKYQWLFSAKTRHRPGPKGPSKELIAAIIKIKRLNPRFGCPRIAQQISHAFGLEIDKDMVRRMLANHHHPKFGGQGPSWLSAIAEARDSLWSVDLFRRKSILLKSFWVMVVMNVFARRIVGFGVERAHVDGISVCRMFNQARCGQQLPKRLSTDHDPLFRFHRWQANSRNRGTQVRPLRASLSSVHRAANRNPSARVSRPDLLLERPRLPSQAGSIRRLLQPAARPLWTGWSDAVRAMQHECMPTGESSSLRLAIRLFRSPLHANCCVISISP